MIAIAFRLTLAVCILLSTACATPPSQDRAGAPMLVLQPLRLARLDDQRAQYRRLFCGLITGTIPCATWLRNFGDEPEAAAGAAWSAAPDVPDVPVNVFVVSGIFGECFPSLQAFGDARADAANGRVRFFDMPIHGRGSTALNAGVVRDGILAELERQPTPGLNIILSYSKGTADALAALAASDQLAGRIDALLSVAGAVNGSPLADAFEDTYATLAWALPLHACQPTDRGELNSLTRAVRLRWLAEHPLPSHPRYYSLITAPTPDRVSKLLRPFYQKLARNDVHNDGQLLAFDMIVPGSTVLGYLNADHFAAALPLLRWHPVALSAFAQPNDFPRQQTISAALALIRHDLAAPRPSSHP